MIDPRKNAPYVSYHYSMTKRDYDTAVNDGRQFETMAGEPLPTAPSVRAELQTSGCVVSR